MRIGWVGEGGSYWVGLERGGPLFYKKHIDCWVQHSIISTGYTAVLHYAVDILMKYFVYSDMFLLEALPLNWIS